MFHAKENGVGIFLDAGSTSTKAYIYEWEHKISTGVPYISLSMSDDNVPRTYKARPGTRIKSPPFPPSSVSITKSFMPLPLHALGIGSISPNSTAVGQYLDPILEWADSIIPDDKKSSTPIYFQVINEGISFGMSINLPIGHWWLTAIV
jgi:hypothetical protein